MKLLFILHMYVPHHNAGGETTVHSMMRAMAQRGHDVEVLCKPHASEQKFDPYTYEGVKVSRPLDNLPNLHAWLCNYVRQFNPDLILTHLDLTFTAMQVALDTEKPLVHIIHNSMQLDHHHVTPARCQLAIFNSHWIAERQKWRGPQMVLHPVVEPERYRCEKGTKITLVNPTPGKGESTFYGLSRLMPDHEFLVVKSVYGEQVFPPAINAVNFPNVEFMDHTADIREVFRKTRVVLMPSLYESYGRVAVEAACAGIPAIVHPTEGLLESLNAEKPDWLVNYTREKLKHERIPTPEQLKGGWVSGAGIFCDRDDMVSWKAQLERLYFDEVYYRSRSDIALALANGLTPEREYDRLEVALVNTASVWNTRKEVAQVKMWTSDRWIWKMADGSFVARDDQRIPVGAGSLYAGKGTQIPEHVAAEHGWLGPDVKAVSAPPENKMIAAPEQTKARKKKEAAA